MIVRRFSDNPHSMTVEKSSKPAGLPLKVDQGEVLILRQFHQRHSVGSGRSKRSICVGAKM